MKEISIKPTTQVFKFAFVLLMAGFLITACEGVDIGIETPTVEPVTSPIVLTGSIGGTVWHDECPNFGEQPVPPGCYTFDGEAEYVGNGILDAGEVGIASVEVMLGVGPCPSEGLAEAMTLGDGGFIFEELIPGDYCLTAVAPGQAKGFWTYPDEENQAPKSRITITVRPGQDVSDASFGWDYLDGAPLEPTTTPVPTATPEPACTNVAEFIGDVTISDGTRFDPGESFTKVWRFRNNGTCIWTTDYAVVHVAGPQFGSPGVKSLPTTVDPGEVIDISLDLIAPMDDGSYKGFWKFRDDSGVLFGFGERGDVAFWVSIEVGPEPEPEFTDWRGEYFANRNLDGEPAFLKNDIVIDKTWGLRSPNEEYLPRDNFSVRWTRYLDFDSKTYRFALDITDGGRLYVDDVLVLDEWVNGERRQATVNVAMEKGGHEIKFEYYNASGGAVAQLTYGLSGELVFEGWKAMYWLDETLDIDIVLIRDEVEINFDWGEGGPFGDDHRDSFFAQWERKVEFESGKYVFQASSDDGIRVFVDDALVIDEWHDSSGVEIYTTQLEMSGEHTITVKYFENAGFAKVWLGWELLVP